MPPSILYYFSSWWTEWVVHPSMHALFTLYPPLTEVYTTCVLLDLSLASAFILGRWKSPLQTTHLLSFHKERGNITQ